MCNECKEKLTAEVKNLMNAPSCCPEAKAACQKWLDSNGDEATTKALKAEVEADIMPIDGLIALAPKLEKTFSVKK